MLINTFKDFISPKNEKFVIFTHPYVTFKNYILLLFSTSNMDQFIIFLSFYPHSFFYYIEKSGQEIKHSFAMHEKKGLEQYEGK